MSNMGMRFYTADFHLGMEGILEYEGRPFQNIGEMDRKLVDECNRQAQDGDIIYHLGDLACWKQDRGMSGLKVKPNDYIFQNVEAMFLNIRGNHDVNNKVTSICESMRTRLGRRYPYVSMSHYPSYDARAQGHFQKGDIHLCGHVHRKWKHCLDLSNNVLNVNVGVDAWDYKILSEDQVVNYLDVLFKKNPNDLLRCKILENWKTQFILPKQYNIDADAAQRAEAQHGTLTQHA